MKITATVSDMHRLMNDAKNYLDAIQIPQFMVAVHESLTAVSPTGQTALHILAATPDILLDKQHIIARVLLFAGADVNAVDVIACTPIKRAVGIDVDFMTISSNNYTNKRRSHPPNYYGLIHRWNCSQQQQQSTNNRYTTSTMVSLLLEHGADVTVCDKWRNTPLHRAVELQDMEISRLLLRHGADVMAKGSRGLFPLTIAVEKGNIEISRLLLEHGADVTVRVIGGAPLAIIRFLAKRDPKLLSIPDQNGNSAIHEACRCGAPYDVIKFLVKHDPGRIRDFNVDGALPLHLLCTAHDVDLASLELLVEDFEESVMCQTYNGDFPLTLAGENNASLDFIFFLVQRSMPFFSHRNNKTKTVRLDVGGHVYKVPQLLLEQNPDTMLARLVGNDEEPIFIDRDGERFRYVLDLLRDGKVFLPLSESYEAFRADLEYFGVEDTEEAPFDIQQGGLAEASHLGRVLKGDMDEKLQMLDNMIRKHNAAIQECNSQKSLIKRASPPSCKCRCCSSFVVVRVAL